MTTETKEFVQGLNLVISTDLVTIKVIKAKFVDQIPSIEPFNSTDPIDLSGYEVVGVVGGALVILKRGNSLAKLHAVRFMNEIWSHLTNAHRSMSSEDARNIARQEFDRLPQLFQE